MDDTTKAIWPDLSLHDKAWELAKVALGPDAPTRDLIAKQGEILTALKAEQKAGK